MVMKEIKDREDTATDISASSKSKDDMTLAQSEAKQKAIDDKVPLQKQKADYWKSSIRELGPFDPSPYATQEARDKAKADYNFTLENFSVKQGLEASEKIIMDGIQVAEKDVIANPRDEKGQATYLEILKTQNTPERARDLVDKAVSEGIELANKQAVDSQLQLAAESEFSAQAVIDRMEGLLSSRSAGEEDSSVLSNTDARDIIDTAEKELSQQKNKREAEEQDAVDQAKNEALSESYDGELTVAELDRRFKAGLLGDDNASRTAYSSLRKTLGMVIPEESDLLVRDEMSTAITRFKAGQISRQDVDTVFLNSLESLDKEDRKKFQNDISTTSTTLIQTGVSNMKAGGSELISPRFRTPDGGIIADIDPTGKKDKEQLAKEKKLLNLEIRLKNLYNDAIDEWIESKAGEDITNRDMRIKENDLKIDFRKIKNQELDKMEADITAIEQPAPVPSMTEQSRSLRQLKTDQLKARREKLRKQLK